MQPTYWHKQSTSQPLFEDLHWARPENRSTAGKLLIIGGNAQSLNAPGVAYAAAVKAGIGTCRVVLPDIVRKSIGNSFPEGEFAFSTPSGSFSKTAINQLLENVGWADGVLLAGDFGRNSETAVLLEDFINKFDGQLTVTDDALDYFVRDIGALTHRANTMFATSLNRLQKITMAGMPSLIIQHKMSLHSLVGLLNSWTRETGAKILTYHNGNIIYADAGQVSTTAAPELHRWEVALSAFCATWWLQYPNKSFSAITTAIYDAIEQGVSK